jgi:V/A-type H+-transporting ATPase subunit F
MIFFCIADKDSSLGFKLSGIVTREVSSRQDALEALSVARATKDVGIILVTEKAANLIKDALHELIYHNELPLILELPSRGITPKRRGTGEFLKEAIGISI